ncbi:MAG: DUF523 domain-containing protein [candidate division Zixibacteria bacterium]|nr:DUF523 domain-containing protein [candidate division Zixibacteria bacterium]
MNKKVILISACLIGDNCRYDGKNKAMPDLDRYTRNHELIPVCPEVEGGLRVPRPRAWIKSGTGGDVLDGKTIVIDENGLDITSNFMVGAKYALEIALANNVKVAILKSRSPSCGKGNVYNASDLVNGNGVTAELLIRNGIEVITV